VRRLERQYYARIFSAADEGGDTEWMRELSDDLKKPVFLMSRSLAFSRRLRYSALFSRLLRALRSSHRLQTQTMPNMIAIPTKSAPTGTPPIVSFRISMFLTSESGGLGIIVFQPRRLTS
jgi:hypothetical protein